MMSPMEARYELEPLDGEIWISEVSKDGEWLLLDVPFSRKDDVKDAGAEWNEEQWRVSAEDYADLVASIADVGVARRAKAWLQYFGIAEFVDETVALPPCWQVPGEIETKVEALTAGSEYRLIRHDGAYCDVTFRCRRLYLVFETEGGATLGLDDTGEFPEVGRLRKTGELVDRDTVVAVESLE